MTKLVLTVVVALFATTVYAEPASQPYVIRGKIAAHPGGHLIIVQDQQTDNKTVTILRGHDE